MRMRWKICASVGLIAVFAAVVAALVVSQTFLHDDRYEVPQIPFDAAAWKAVDAQHAPQVQGFRTVRSNMIDDLLKRYNFKSWTRQQVIDLLGPSDERGDAFSQWDMVYVLGLQRAGALSLDSEALGFQFDDQDRVKEYRLDID
jgi:hypothetical protein